jgi:hypothetical protein
LGIEAVNRQTVDRRLLAPLQRDSHDQPERLRCRSGRSPLVARVHLCGAMARLIDQPHSIIDCPPAIGGLFCFR